MTVAPGACLEPSFTQNKGNRPCKRMIPSAWRGLLRPHGSAQGISSIGDGPTPVVTPERLRIASSAPSGPSTITSGVIQTPPMPERAAIGRATSSTASPLPARRTGGRSWGSGPSRCRYTAQVVRSGSSVSTGPFSSRGSAPPTERHPPFRYPPAAFFNIGQALSEQRCVACAQQV
jgi:hypothetical protein